MYGEKVKLYCMDTESFVAAINTYDIYEDVTDDVGTRSETSIMNQIYNYLKEKKVIELMKYELG